MHNVSCKTQLPWQYEDSDKSLVALEGIYSCDDKGKTSSKKNDNTTNPLMESNMKKLENHRINVRKNTKNTIIKIIL